MLGFKDIIWGQKCSYFKLTKIIVSLKTKGIEPDNITASNEGFLQSSGKVECIIESYK